MHAAIKIHHFDAERSGGGGICCVAENVPIGRGAGVPHSIAPLAIEWGQHTASNLVAPQQSLTPSQPLPPAAASPET